VEVLEDRDGRVDGLVGVLRLRDGGLLRNRRLLGSSLRSLRLRVGMLGGLELDEEPTLSTGVSPRFGFR
jgi:hypothetical protein